MRNIMTKNLHSLFHINGKGMICKRIVELKAIHRLFFNHATLGGSIYMFIIIKDMKYQTKQLRLVEGISHFKADYNCRM